MVLSISLSLLREGSPPFQIFGSAPLGGRGVWLVGTKSQLFLKIQNGGSPESFPTRKLLYLNNVLSLKNKLTKRITIIALLIHDRHQTMLNPPKISEKPPKENRALPIEQVFTLQISYFAISMHFTLAIRHCYKSFQF